MPEDFDPETFDRAAWQFGQWAPAPPARKRDPDFSLGIKDLALPCGATRKYWICGRCLMWGSSSMDGDDCGCRNRDEQEIVYRTEALFDPHVVQAVTEEIIEAGMREEDARQAAEKILVKAVQSARGPNPWALS